MCDEYTSAFSTSQPSKEELRLPEFKPPLAALRSKYAGIKDIIFNEKYPPHNDAVFGAIFSEKNIFEQTISAILGKPITLAGEPIAQAFNNAKNADLNSVRFDILGKGTDDVDYSIDMQRAYNKERLHARTVYYACRLLATQKVAESRYECLPGVCISFIYENGTTPSSFINKVSLYNQNHDKYSDIFEIVEIYLKAIPEPSDNICLHIIRSFLGIRNQNDADSFSRMYGNNAYAVALISAYNAVTSRDYTRALDSTDLDGGYIMFKLSEEERIRLREEGIREGAKLSEEERIHLKEEGIKEGREKGKEEGVTAAILTYIRTRYDAATQKDAVVKDVAASFNIPQSEAERLYYKALENQS